jgi:uncharacterized repeat protein (TIGR01451 family)
MSYRWILKNSLKRRYLIVVGLAVSCAINADESDAPTVILRAELRVPQTDGLNTYHYVPANKVEQGQEIDYTVRITNPGMTPLAAAMVVQALPLNTRYVAGSATGAGADIQFSVDGGRSFAKPVALRSPVNGGRVAGAAEYTHIRWQLRYPLAAKAVVLARFRAVFE